MAELQDLTSTNFEDTYYKVVETPDKWEMDGLIALSGEMKNDVRKLTKELAENKWVISKLEWSYDQPLTPV